MRFAPAQLTVVVLDSPVLLADARCLTLLGLPFGTGLLVDQLRLPAMRAGCSRIVVVRPSEHGNGLHRSADAERGVGVETMTPAEFSSYLVGTESSDYLLVVDPSLWPTAGYDFDAIVRHSRMYRGAVHALSIGSNPGCVREHVDSDEHGHVRSVQRLYNLMNWPTTEDSAPLCSLVPARALQDIQLNSLPEIRSALVAAGLFTQDMPVASDVFDLRSEEGILGLNNWVVLNCAKPSKWEGWNQIAKGVWAGRDCSIHASCRFVPPVIIHPGTKIAGNVQIIGPTVIGKDCRIQRDAFISHAVLAGGTAVPPRTVIDRRVLAGQLQADKEYIGAPPPEAPSPDAEAGLDQAIAQRLRRKRVHFVLKRTMDIVASGLGLIVLSPLLILVALLVKLTSPGPIFFVHRRERMGEKGDFPCLKFRTMVSGAHLRQRELYSQSEVDGPQFKIDSDPRITRLGQFLRITNIDELPQLINVLLGQMSLVGPRPSPFRENQICLPWRRARLSIRPGITGLWQLCRVERDSGDFHQWIEYDISYVRNFSIWLDIKILAYTILTRGGRRRVSLNQLIREQ